MPRLSEFNRYLAFLCEALGHTDRHGGLVSYCRGLMLPLKRKSIEPLAAHSDPEHVCAAHQSLHHFVAKSDWSDQAVLAKVQDWVLPHLDTASGSFWIVDDVGFPKKGHCSVGVSRQYCGQLGKQDNCQVAVSLSLATERGSIPVAWQLYLPEEWIGDAARRNKVGIPDSLEFMTKPTIALVSSDTRT